MAAGAGDGGTIRDRIGVLHDFRPIELGGFKQNEIDAALAKPDSNSQVEPGIRGLGPVQGSLASPPLRAGVRKVGWQTGYTVGTLYYREMSFLMLFAGHGDALFVGQYGVEADDGGDFAKPGDSGSVLIDGQNRAVGLVFGTSRVGKIAFANPIDPVLTYFGVEPA